MKKMPNGITDYEFWLWEYQRRSTRYINSFESFVKDIIDALAERLAAEANSRASELDLPSQLNVNNLAQGNTATDSIDCNNRKKFHSIKQAIIEKYINHGGLRDVLDFLNTHHRIPLDPDYGMSGHELLQKFLLKDEAIDFDIFNFSIPRIFSVAYNCKDANNVLVRFDLSNGYDIATLEAAWLLSISMPTKEETDAQIAQEAASVEALNRIRLWWAKRNFERLTLPKAPRAVGLWLWDFQQKNNSTQVEAVEAFQHQFIDERLQNQPTQFKHPDKLRKLAKLTCDCIEQVAVLPLI